MSTVNTCPFLSTKISEAAKVVLGIPKFIDDVPSNGSTLPGAMEETEQQIAERYIWSRLAKLGIYNDSDSNDLLLSPECAEGDARHVFCENGEPNLPVVRFKKLWSILKSGTKSVGVVEEDDELFDVKSLSAQLSVGLSAMKPIGQLTDAELLAKYGPECSDEITDELHKRAKRRPFIAFSNEIEGIVDVDVSLRLLKEARKRETPIHYKAGDSLLRLFKAGDFPTQVYFECPLHKEVLLLDGYCDKCGHSWEGIPNDVRQFVRVIADSGEAPDSSPGIRQLIATARQFGENGGLEALQIDYPKEWIVYAELAAEERLPSLKSRTAALAGSRTSDPFSPSKRY